MTHITPNRRTAQCPKCNHAILIEIEPADYSVGIMIPMVVEIAGLDCPHEDELMDILNACDEATEHLVNNLLTQVGLM